MAKIDAREQPYDDLCAAGSRVRAIAYLLESHNNEIQPLHDMSEVWSVVGNILDDLGSEILEITRELDEAHIGSVREKM